MSLNLFSKKYVNLKNFQKCCNGALFDPTRCAFYVKASLALILFITYKKLCLGGLENNSALKLLDFQLFCVFSVKIMKFYMHSFLYLFRYLTIYDF